MLVIDAQSGFRRCVCDGRLLVDVVGRWETLSQDFACVCRRLGLDLKLPVENASRRTGYQGYYSDATRKLIATRYEADIKAFGYAF